MIIRYNNELMRLQVSIIISRMCTMFSINFIIVRSKGSRCARARRQSVKTMLESIMAYIAVKKRTILQPKARTGRAGVTVAGASRINVKFTGRGAVHTSCGIQCDRQSGKPSDAIYGPAAR